MELINHILAEYSNLFYVLVGLILLSIATAVIGNFLVLKKQSLMGDAVSHSVLPGLVLAYLFLNTKSTLVLLGGAFISGWISVFLIDWIVKNSKIKYDAALAITLSTFFGAGMMLLTYVQQNQIGTSAGLENYIFGSAATLIGDDVLLLSLLTFITLFFTFIFYKELKTFVFSEEYFQSISQHYHFIKTLYLNLIVLVIVIGISVFGVVLISALLIIPSIISSFWSDRLWKRIILSCLFSVLSSIGAAFISLYIDNMPTGPWVVLFLGMFLFVSIITRNYFKILKKKKS